MQTLIRVYTLGRFAIERDGQVLDNFLSTKTGVLFTYLAMNPGEHSRDRLAALFWSETNDEQSLKNLRTVLSSLRRQLDDTLVISRKTLAIRDDAAVWVDARAFELACEQGFSAVGTLNPFQEMRDLAAIYQGPFLSTVRIRDADTLDEWISVQQNRLAQLHRELLAGIVERAIEQARYPVGLQTVRDLISLDPLWETPRRQLMRLLAASDRLSEALVQYELFAQLLRDELNVAPDGETTRLYDQLKSGTTVTTPRTTASSIASPDMLFVEPAEDVEFAQRMLNSPQCRLLTIYGISGIGKTALAAQIAFHRQNRYRDGACFISLTPVQHPSNLPLALARALRIEVLASATHSMIEESVADYLREREMLLVLDNYEHLLPDTAFVERLLASAPHLQLVIGSQNPLNLYHEWLLPLRGLQVPEQADDNAVTSEAVQLFTLTAQRLNPRFNVQDVLPNVVRICQLVDGLPLAIILAAGWTQVLPVSKIAEHIADGMEFSISYQQTLPARHQSIEMMLEYTWNTLDLTQQQVLTTLSVFEGAFDLTAFTSLCDASMDVLFTLIQKSLILKFDETYRIHQLIGRYARRKLFYDPNKGNLASRYLDHYTTWMRDLQSRALPVHEYLVEIEAQYQNIWNFQWMPSSYQPVYVLSMSRFLMVYWEISHSVAVAEVLQRLLQFEQTDTGALEPHWHRLLYLQLARLYHSADQHTDETRYLDKAFSAYGCTDAWVDHAVLYSLYTMARNEQTTASAFEDTEATILTSVYFNLVLLNLDMHDLLLTSDLFVQLRDSLPGEVEHAALYGAQAALAAEANQPADACDLYAEALACLKSADVPALRLMFEASLLQLTYRLQRHDAVVEHMVTTLTLAARQDIAGTLANTLQFCEDVQKQAGSEWVAHATQGLSAETRAHPQIAAFMQRQAG